jgi:hypothetical protein
LSTGPSSPVVGAPLAPYHPALTKRDAMPDEDRKANWEPPSHHSRRAAMFAVAIAALSVGTIIATSLWRSDSPATGSPSSPLSSIVPTTTTTIERNGIEARLRDILRVRDRAYQERDINLLRQVYTADCPCLRGDGAAIRQLQKDNAVWVGAYTSVRIKKLEKVNGKIWVIIANFTASPFRIETESGSLIRAVEGRTELFRFVLAKTSSSRNLLLGFAAPVDASD